MSKLMGALRHLKLHSKVIQPKLPGHLHLVPSFESLGHFNTIIVVDDSRKMFGSDWRDAGRALKWVVSVCSKYNGGVDVHFLNHQNAVGGNEKPRGGYNNIATRGRVNHIFSGIAPEGSKAMGVCFKKILKPYMKDLRRAAKSSKEHAIEPLNVIVISNGVVASEVEGTLLKAARKLDAIGAPPWQVGFQLLQVGRVEGSAERYLKENFPTKHGVRSMVDTMWWPSGDGNALTAQGELKIVLGGVVDSLRQVSRADDTLKTPGGEALAWFAMC